MTGDRSGRVTDQALKLDDGRSRVTGLVEHLETYLGEISSGWTQDPDGNEMPFQMASFSRGPAPGVISISTLGLSRHVLRLPTTDDEVRLELTMFAPEALLAGSLPAVLHQIGMKTLASHRALSRGDVLGPAGPVVPGSAMEAFYVGAPTCYPDEFQHAQEDGYSITIAWLIPISAREADYARRHGRDAFERRLVELAPELTDLYREPLPL